MEDTSFIDSDKKPSKAKKIWLILVVVALIASNTAWVLFYFKQQGELQATIAQLKVDKTKLSRDLAAAKKEASKKTESETTEWREIPELGVKYKLDSQTEKLTYSYNGIKDAQTILWSTVDLANLSTDGAGCNSYDGAVVVWSKQKSELSESKSKKVGNETIYRVLPDGGDSLRPTNCQDTKLLDAARTAEQKAFDSLEAI